MSRTFSTNCGSVESLNVSVRCGCSENARALHRGRRDTRRLRHVAGAPVRRARRLLLERLDHDGFDLVVADLARRTASGLVAEAGEAVLGEPLAPRAHGLARDADLGGDRAIVEPVGGEQHDVRALRIATY